MGINGVIVIMVVVIAATIWINGVVMTALTLGMVPIVWVVASTTMFVAVVIVGDIVIVETTWSVAVVLIFLLRIVKTVVIVGLRQLRLLKFA